MARQIIALLEKLGHHVIVVSHLRSWLRQPGDFPALAEAAEREIARITSEVVAFGPDLWFTYHLYYRAPDLLGPRLVSCLGIPYVAAEASHAPRRMIGEWAQAERASVKALHAAQVLLALTQRDADGLARCQGLRATIMRLPPFLAETTATEPPCRVASARIRIVCVAMMRHGDKLVSYRLLAQALSRLEHLAWELHVVGDGPARPETEAAFAGFAAGRVTFRGLCDAPAVRAELDAADIFAWPGMNEAYGMVYLEAGERGLPVVAMDSGGVSSVVHHDLSGLLAAEGDVPAFADALQSLIGQPALRAALGKQARHIVLSDHGPESASQILNDALARAGSALRRSNGE